MFALFQAAQETAASGGVGAGLAIGLTVIGAGIGIGQIGAQMAAGIARQPEATANIQTASIILAALIEGAALFGLGLAFLKF
ncbi:MAG: ATP synthase F0 subunit C [Gemmatimonadota bacterium]|nr:ATP synthase F0 subunit C [Gemmatimonadota bacterium]MDH5760273.1 ATP synthase F0 subunit C [Gemmatimonadota bacterium]